MSEQPWEAAIVEASVNVVVITYRRPDQLRSALLSLQRAADYASDHVVAAVTVVDDDPDLSAFRVVEEFERGFAGSCHYVTSGASNIAMARNRGIEAALGTCDWIGAIDDDVQVPEQWFEVCLEALSSGSYTAVTGSLTKDFSAGPPWLRREPFDQVGITSGEDGSFIDVCATGNNWVHEQFLAAHPELRFDPDYGVTGGEDVQFFWRAVAKGLRPVFCRAASVTEPEPPYRCTLSYQVRRAFWLGLLEGRMTNGASRLRVLARAGKRAVTVNHKSLRAEERRRRGLRYGVCIYAQCFGVVLGLVGVKLRHK